MLWTLSRFRLRWVGEMLCISWVKQTAPLLEKKNFEPWKIMRIPRTACHHFWALQKRCHALSWWPILWQKPQSHFVDFPGLHCSLLPSTTGCTPWGPEKYGRAPMVLNWSYWDGNLVGREGHPLPNIRGCVTKTLVELEQEYLRLSSAFRLLKRIRSH